MRTASVGIITELPETYMQGDRCRTEFAGRGITDMYDMEVLQPLLVNKCD
jgi:hypothetical protein